MKVKLTEIECSAEELRQCNTVSDGIRVFENEHVVKVED